MDAHMCCLMSNWIAWGRRSIKSDQRGNAWECASDRDRKVVKLGPTRTVWKSICCSHHVLC